MITLQNPPFILLAVLAVPAVRFLIKRNSYSRKIGISRALMIVLLALAAASPAITEQKTRETSKEVNVLLDNTTSMKTLEEIQVPEGYQESTFAVGETREILSNAAKALEENSYNLLLTDGQTEESAQTLIQAANQKNSTISFLEPEEKDEAAVTIQGPSKTVPEAENSFTVDISSTIGKVPLTVKVDGEKIFQGEVEDSYSFRRSFESKGDYSIEAEIESQDIFPDNNQYFKTVEVRQKPSLLIMGDAGKLEEELENFYKIEIREDLPEDLSKYYAAILKQETNNPNRIEDFIAQGNGVVHTGEIQEKQPRWLPIEKTEEEEEGEAGAKVILLIDISTGTGICVDRVGSFCLETSSKGGTAKQSIRIAYSIVDTLDRNNKIGAVAYNRDSFLVSKPVLLATEREELKDKISRLPNEGPSFHDRGLKGASSLANENDTVVMLTDGKIGEYEENRNVPRKLSTISQSMDAKLITVGMGENPNKLLLEDIAGNTDGYYLENSEAGRLKFRFGAGGGNTEFTPIEVVNPTHFITEDLELDGGVSGFRPVRPRDSAELLVSGSNGKEVLTAWRYGLGRVAAFSGGETGLGRLIETDPALVSRTVSWAVGNPQRNQDKWLEVRDSHRPLSPVARASYRVQGMSRVSENLYERNLPSPSLGMHEWNGEAYAYNYNPEKQGAGVDRDKLVAIARETGGEIFSSGQNLDLSEKAGSKEKQIQETTSLSPYLLLAAILVFLVEVGYRKRQGQL